MSRNTVANFVQALIAVVVGNAVYILLLPYLPPAARHVPLRLDIGLLVDFWFCLVVFGIVKMLAERSRQSKLHKQ